MESILAVVHDGSSLNKNKEVLALNLYSIKFFTEKIKRYIMYVKGMRFLFVILKRKSRRKSGFTLYAFDSLTGRRFTKHRCRCVCDWDVDLDRTLIEES